MGTKFGVRPRCVRGPTVSEGYSQKKLAADERGFAQIRENQFFYPRDQGLSAAGFFWRVALPHGRASDTIAGALIICVLVLGQPLGAVAQRKTTVTVDTS